MWQKLKQWLILFRVGNLAMIALTQYLVIFCIILPVYHRVGLQLQLTGCMQSLLILSTVAIAAAGNVINDYFDISIDRINRPGRVVLGRMISRQKAILLHWGFSAAGLVFAFVLSMSIGRWYLGFMQFVVVVMLWRYSVRMKRKFLRGNVAVAFLTAMIPVVVWIFEYALLDHRNFAGLYGNAMRMITVFITGYAFFAFLTTLQREIIKDAEDYFGDRAHGCDTLPIRYGLKVARQCTFFMGVILSLLTLVAQYYFWSKGYRLMSGYLGLFVFIPTVILGILLLRSKDSRDFFRCSQLSKGVMLAGVLSMVLMGIWI